MELRESGPGRPPPRPPPLASLKAASSARREYPSSLLLLLPLSPLPRQSCCASVDYWPATPPSRALRPLPPSLHTQCHLLPTYVLFFSLLPSLQLVEEATFAFWPRKQFGEDGGDARPLFCMREFPLKSRAVVAIPTREPWARLPRTKLVYLDVNTLLLPIHNGQWAHLYYMQQNAPLLGLKHISILRASLLCSELRSSLLTLQVTTEKKSFVLGRALSSPLIARADGRRARKANKQNYRSQPSFLS